MIGLGGGEESGKGGRFRGADVKVRRYRKGDGMRWRG